VRSLASFSTSLKFELLAFENTARYPNDETNFLGRSDRRMPLPILVKLGSRTPEKAVSSAPAPKIAQQKRAKSSITRRRIIRFRSNFVESLFA